MAKKKAKPKDKKPKVEYTGERIVLRNQRTCELCATKIRGFGVYGPASLDQLRDVLVLCATAAFGTDIAEAHKEASMFLKRFDTMVFDPEGEEEEVIWGDEDED